MALHASTFAKSRLKFATSLAAHRKETAGDSAFDRGATARTVAKLRYRLISLRVCAAEKKEIKRLALAAAMAPKRKRARKAEFRHLDTMHLKPDDPARRDHDLTQISDRVWRHMLLAHGTYVAASGSYNIDRSGTAVQWFTCRACPEKKAQASANAAASASASALPAAMPAVPQPSVESSTRSCPMRFKALPRTSQTQNFAEPVGAHSARTYHFFI